VAIAVARVLDTTAGHPNTPSKSTRNTTLTTTDTTDAAE
jgi:hypothetical protein